MKDPQTIITQCRNWIEKVVIGCNFCPFAARELTRKSIRFQLAGGTEPSVILASLPDEFHLLDRQEDIETSLIILPEFSGDFYEYLDCLQLAEDLLINLGYEGVYQLASFHPDYQFAGTDPEDASNYTNRSPWPMIHILREESLSRVLDNYSEPEKIPERNVAYAQEKGVAYMKALRDSCF